MAILFTKKYQRKNFFMKQVVFDAAGYTVHEYALVLQPHEDLFNTIMQEKKFFSETYDCSMALQILPRITMVHFKQHELMEPHIIRQLKNITATVSSFKIELKDFSSFPSHTIYIKVVSKVQIMDIAKQIRAAQKLMKLDDENKPHFLTEPYITIARNLQPWQYEKSWLEYEHKNFHGRFIADHAVLLKRKEGGCYKAIEKFRFMGLKEIKQPSLF
jgi:2'-5' RNA ligase